MRVRIKRLTKTAKLPTYAHEGDAGMDLCADLRGSLSVVIPGLDAIMLNTGIAMQIHLGFEGHVRSRSGLAYKSRVRTFFDGTIDSTYRGEIRVMLENLSSDDFLVGHGDRIAQLVISPVERVELVEADELSGTERGDVGFGSTGMSS